MIPFYLDNSTRIMELSKYYSYHLDTRLRIGPVPTVALALLAGVVLAWGIVFHSPFITLVALIELSLAIAIFNRPKWGLLAFVIVANLLPFAVSPVKLFGFGPTFIDIVLTATLTGWLFWAFYHRRPISGGGFGLLILLYLGFALLSFVLGLTYSISPERFRLFLKSINSTLLFFSVINCVQSRDELKKLVVGLILGGMAASLIALAILALPDSTAIEILSSLGPLGYPTGSGVLRPIADTEIIRAIGTSIDPNVLGGLLMMGSAMAAGQLIAQKPVLDRRLLGVALMVAVAGLLLTYSRSALGGLVIGVAVIGIYRDRRVLLAMIVAAMLLPILPQFDILLSRLQSGLTFQDRAAAMRLDEYANAFKTIAAYPWFGIGFGDTPSIDLFLGVSSIYLLIGQEMGLVGLSSFLAILALLAWKIVAAIGAAKDEEIRGVLLSLAAAMLAAASAGLLDHYYVNIVFPHMVGLFWFYIGLSVVAARLATE
ncbi:MAG: O-antigen ligase family protein [Chloroflexota bacterium]|jgi:O-antigen ligase